MHRCVFLIFIFSCLLLGGIWAMAPWPHAGPMTQAARRWQAVKAQHCQDSGATEMTPPLARTKLRRSEKQCTDARAAHTCRLARSSSANHYADAWTAPKRRIAWRSSANDYASWPPRCSQAQITMLTLELVPSADLLGGELGKKTRGAVNDPAAAATFVHL